MTLRLVACFVVSIISSGAFVCLDAYAAKEQIAKHLNQAAKFAKAGDYEKTLQECDLVLREDPRNVSAFKQRIAVFYLTKRYSTAMRACDAMIHADKNNADFLLVRALLSGMLDNIEPAMQDFNNAIKSNPNRIEGYFFRGNFALLQGQRRNAIKDYDLAIAKGKGHPAVYLAHYFRGRAEDMEGKVDAAMRDYAESIKLDPGKLPPIIANDPLFSQCMPPLATDTKLGLIERAQLLAQTGRYKEAVQDFDILLQKNTKDAVLHMTRGNCLYMIGEAKKAIADYDRALQLSPHLSDPIMNRGYAYLCLRKFDKAAFDLENWMVVTFWHDDEAPRVAALCSASYALANKPQKGKHVVDKTLSKNEGDQWATPLLKFAQGALSTEALLKVSTNVTKQTQARTLLGLHFLAKGKTKEANDQFVWVKSSGDKKALEFPIACSLLQRASNK